MSADRSWPEEEEIRVLAYLIHRDSSMRGRTTLSQDPEPLTKIHVLLAESSLFLEKLFSGFLEAMGRPYFRVVPAIAPDPEFLRAWSSAAWEVDYDVRMEIKAAAKALDGANLPHHLMDWFLAENTLALKRLSRPYDHEIHQHELRLVPTLTEVQASFLQQAGITTLEDLANHDEGDLYALFAARGMLFDAPLMKTLASRLVGSTPGLEVWGIGFRGPVSVGDPGPPAPPPPPPTEVGEPVLSRDELVYRQESYEPEALSEPSRFCSFESLVHGGWFIRHRRNATMVQRPSTPQDRVDATLRTPAEDDSFSPTLGASNIDEHYLRHRDWRIWLDAIDYERPSPFLEFDYDELGQPFADDSHFERVPGLLDPEDPTLVSFRSRNYPDHYICSRRDNIDGTRFPLWVQSPSSPEALTDPLPFARRATFRRRAPLVWPCVIQVWSFETHVEAPDYQPYYWRVGGGGIEVVRREWLSGIPLIERAVWNDPACLFIARLGFRGASAGAISIESFSRPGFFVRHRHSRLELGQLGDDDPFQQDASFTYEPTDARWSEKILHYDDDGLPSGWHMEARTTPSVRLGSVNYPEQHVRHRDHQLFIAGYEGRTDEKYDSSDKFRIIFPG